MNYSQKFEAFEERKRIAKKYSDKLKGKNKVFLMDYKSLEYAKLNLSFENTYIQQYLQKE
jgi:hypothetical protein